MRYNPQKNRRQQRRSRFDVAAAERAQRAAARMPIIKPALVGALAIAVLLMIAIAWYNGPAWRISAIEVRNNDAVPVEQIIGASGLQGEHYQFADLSGAAARVDELPGVEGAEVTCSWFWSTSCQIAVQPAQPLALWQSPLGNVWTDFEGKVQRAPEQLSARLSIRVEDGPAPAIGVPLDAGMLRALTELSAGQPQLKRLYYSQEFGLMIEGDRGARIRLGSGESDGAILEKFRLAQTLSAQLRDKGVTPRIIDVRYIKAPYYIK
jgi:cell division septal protein FtsQ